MKPVIKFLLITVIFGIISFLLTPALWTKAMGVNPTQGQLPFFIALSVIESVVFGIGISFIVLSWPFLKRFNQLSRKLTFATYLAISWLLVSWWPHDNFHMQNGLYLQGLLYIDYVFHVTIIIASLIVAYFFYSLI